MSETRRSYDRESRAGAVRIVTESGKPIAQVARELGIHAGTLGNWVRAERRLGAGGASDTDERAELVRLRGEVAQLRMDRDLLKRSVVLWVNEATK